VSEHLHSQQASPLRLNIESAKDAERVTAAHLEACGPALEVAQGRLASLQRAGNAGFLSLDWQGWQATESRKVAQRLAGLGDTMLLLGIGGSALGGRAIHDALAAEATAGRRLEVLDTLDPATVQRCLSGLDPQRVVVAAVSRSGSTLETLALLRICMGWLQDSLGDAWSERLVLVTATDSGPLRQLARERDIACLPVPTDVGGRFSVLTAVGLLPAAFLGLDVDSLCAGAEAQKQLVLQPDLATNPAWQLAAVHHCWREHLSNSVLLSYSDALLGFGSWLRQLVAESLGKVGSDGQWRGWSPSIARGPADQHSQLQLWRDGSCNELFTILHVEQQQSDLAVPSLAGPEDEPGRWLQGKSLHELVTGARLGTTAALRESGAPIVDLAVKRLDAAALGALFVLFETTVVLLGLVQGVDPFDQPAVEAAKGYTAGLLGHSDCEADGQRARALLGKQSES